MEFIHIVTENVALLDILLYKTKNWSLVIYILIIPHAFLVEISAYTIELLSHTLNKYFQLQFLLSYYG